MAKRNKKLSSSDISYNTGPPGPPGSATGVYSPRVQVLSMVMYGVKIVNLRRREWRSCLRRRRARRTRRGRWRAGTRIAASSSGTAWSGPCSGSRYSPHATAAAWCSPATRAEHTGSMCAVSMQCVVEGPLESCWRRGVFLWCHSSSLMWSCNQRGTDLCHITAMQCSSWRKCRRSFWTAAMQDDGAFGIMLASWRLPCVRIIREWVLCCMWVAHITSVTIWRHTEFALRGLYADWVYLFAVRNLTIEHLGESCV